MKRNTVHKLAKQFGYDLRRHSKHLVWRHCQTGAVVTTAATPSDWRALKNIQKQFAYGAAQ